MVGDLNSFPAQAHPLDAISCRASRTAMTHWRRQPLVVEGSCGGLARKCSSGFLFYCGSKQSENLNRVHWLGEVTLNPPFPAPASYLFSPLGTYSYPMGLRCRRVFARLPKATL